MSSSGPRRRRRARGSRRGPHPGLLLAAAAGAVVLVVVLVTRGLDEPDRPGAPDAPAGASTVALDPRGHAEGGCVALSPAGPPRATVALDPGHGGPDPGSSGRTDDGRSIDEKDVTLPVALAAADRLRERGVRVVLTRSTDALGARLGPGDVAEGALTEEGLRTQLTARARCANLARADAFVSIHLNAFDDPSVGGAETLYDPGRPFADGSRALASSLHDAVLDAHARAGRPTIDRGLLGGGGTGSAAQDVVVLAPPSDRVRDPSLMPGALIEPLFVTRPEDLGFTAGERGRAVLADAIAGGVERYLDGRTGRAGAPPGGATP